MIRLLTRPEKIFTKSKSIRRYTQNLFNPTVEHKLLREMVRSFAETEIDQQALQYDKQERFNIDLFRKLGTLGLHGITVDTKYGGSGMDATAAIIIAGKN
jgi:isovaleryl-CoA dehydrogenase